MTVSGYENGSFAARCRAECALCAEMHEGYAQCRYCLFRHHMVAGKFYIGDHRGTFCGRYAYPEEKPAGVADGSEKCRFFERDPR